MSANADIRTTVYSGVHFNPISVALNAEANVGVLAGSISYTLYHVDGEVPERYHEEFLERIEEFKFEPLLPDSEDDTSIGWVRVDDMLRWDFTKDSVFRGNYVLLSLRTDRWSFPAALLRATVAQRTAAFKEEKGRTRLSKMEREVIREDIRREFKKQMLPSAGTVDMAWDVEQGIVRFWSQSGRVKEQFQEFFESTFDVRLHENNPYIAARALSLTGDEIEALADIEYTDFGSDA